MPKKILITGISGFIGRHLANRLIAIGYDVYGIDNRNIIIPNVKIIRLDIVKDLDKIREVCKDKDILIHLAAVTTHDELVNKTDFSANVNYNGTKNFLDAFNGKIFIYPSSGKVYGKQGKLPFSEDALLYPTTVLGDLKLKIEELIRKYSSKDKNYSVLRIFNVYGPEQKECFLIPTIIKQLNNNEMILGDINGKRDYFYIDDLIEAFVTIINSKIKGFNVFNVGSGESISPKEIVSTFGKIIGKDIKIKIDESKLRKGEFDEERANISKLKKLGWEPKVGIEEGLKRILKDFNK